MSLFNPMMLIMLDVSPKTLEYKSLILFKISMTGKHGLIGKVLAM